MFVALVFCLLPSTGARAELVLRFEAESVTVSGVKAGGEVALFDVGRRFEGWSPMVRFGARVLTAEAGAESVTQAVGGGVVPMSVWMAVDLDTGASVVGSPPGFEPGGLVLGSTPVLTDTSGAASALALPGGRYFAFVARPGEKESRGAWQVQVFDGGDEDADRIADGAIEVSVPALSAVGESPEAPAGLSAGDVVLVVDPRRIATAAFGLDDALEDLPVTGAPAAPTTALGNEEVE